MKNCPNCTVVVSRDALSGAMDSLQSMLAAVACDDLEWASRLGGEVNAAYVNELMDALG